MLFFMLYVTKCSNGCYCNSGQGVATHALCWTHLQNFLKVIDNIYPSLKCA